MDDKELWEAPNAHVFFYTYFFLAALAFVTAVAHRFVLKEGLQAVLEADTACEFDSFPWNFN